MFYETKFVGSWTNKKSKVGDEIDLVRKLNVADDFRVYWDVDLLFSIVKVKEDILSFL